MTILESRIFFFFFVVKDIIINGKTTESRISFFYGKVIESVRIKDIRIDEKKMKNIFLLL